jgi:hypothetical protein
MGKAAWHGFAHKPVHVRNRAMLPIKSVKPFLRLAIYGYTAIELNVVAHYDVGGEGRDP